MKCCGKELGIGRPYVMLRYWCAECNTEHLVDATELTTWLALREAEMQQADHGKLPNLL